MQTHFHKPTDTDPQLLLKFEVDAITQEDLVMEVFRGQRVPMAWHEVAACLPGDIHEGSLKRAITNLYKSCLLTKLDETVTGKYGKQVHRYKLVE